EGKGGVRKWHVGEIMDVWADAVAQPAEKQVPVEELPVISGPMKTSVKVGGPWEFYESFRIKHGLRQLPVAAGPEIAVRPGTVVAVPVHVIRPELAQAVFTLTADVPAGGEVTGGTGKVFLALRPYAPFSVE